MDFKITSIPDDTQTDWKVYINGNSEPLRVRSITIRSKFGEVAYGMRPEGYDSVVFFHPEGQDVICLPYCLTPDGDLLIGLIKELRLNISDKPAYNAIGGQREPGETKEKAVIRETQEEAGVEANDARILQGMPSVQDRLLFSDDIDGGQGTATFAVEIPFNSLKPAGTDDDGDTYYVHKDDLPEDREADIHFLAWRSAIWQTPDAVTRAGIAQLLAEVR